MTGQLIFPPLPTIDERMARIESDRMAGSYAGPYFASRENQEDFHARAKERMTLKDMMDLEEAAARTCMSPAQYREMAEKGEALLFDVPEDKAAYVPRWAITRGNLPHPVAVDAAKLFRTFRADAWADTFCNFMTETTVTFDAEAMSTATSLVKLFDAAGIPVQGRIAMTQTMADALYQIHRKKGEGVAQAILGTIRGTLGANAGERPLQPFRFTPRG